MYYISTDNILRSDTFTDDIITIFNDKIIKRVDMCNNINCDFDFRNINNYNITIN